MAVTTTEAVPSAGGAGHPSELHAHPRSRWLGYHAGTALLGAVFGYLLGRYAGSAAFDSTKVVELTGTNNTAEFLALGMGNLGFLIGIGAFENPVRKILGLHQPETEPEHGWTRYFKMTTDHKVVGVQYLVAVLGLFFTGGMFAMAIRTELLTPYTHFYGPTVYLQVVSEHGTIMMMMASSLVVGPLGNWLVPIMIGSRRMAYPRLEALSLWLFVAGFLTILIALPLGGFNTGWTGYAPLQTQTHEGMDAYLVGFAVIGLGMILNGFNQVVTIIDFRAPGMRWSRLPFFVWSMFATSFLLTLATPVLFVAVFFGSLDRSWQTAFYVNIHGGNNYLWENLFWFFGHPEVYIMAIPAFGIVGELLPVFCRKPLFGYKVGAAGLLGVALLSFFVWQHHLFMSGINPDMRPVFMLTTELISIPTSFVYLVGMGTLWRARIRFTAPMLFMLAFYFNFLIGGATGVYQSDVPIDTTVHGSFFVMAHFHYTIMGGLVFAFFGAVYYWMPRVTGIMLNQRLAKIHFWWMFIGFNFTFFPLFIVGFLDQPRRVFEYAGRLTLLNDWVSASAFFLGSSFIVFIVNFVWCWFLDPEHHRTVPNPWESKGIEWLLPSTIPWYNFDRIPVILNDPYRYGEPDALPVADLSQAVTGTGPPLPESEFMLTAGSSRSSGDGQGDGRINPHGEQRGGEPADG